MLAASGGDGPPAGDAVCSPTANPAEVCDGLDNDCNGTVDDPGATGCTTLFADFDGDTFGDPTDSACLCAPGAPYTAAAGDDCDDTSTACTTLCDDRDADGTWDCRDTCVDIDRDDYGVGTACPAFGVDCDELDPNSYPGAPELCDGNDNDCSAGVPPNETDDDGDFRVECTGWSDTQGDDPTILDGGDCVDTDGDIYDGRPESFDGKDNDCDLAVDECVADCNCNRADLIGCYEFEGNCDDGSMHGNDATVVTNVTYPTGVVGTAASVDPTSFISAPDSMSYDFSTVITMEAWIYARSLPSSGRVGIVDNNGQWGFFIYAPDQVRCSAAGAANWNAATIAPDTWTHVLCTYDGASMTSYQDGMPTGSVPGTGPIGTTNPDPIVIGGDSPAGDRFDGMIDNLKIWNAVLSASDACRRAGSC